MTLTVSFYIPCCRILLSIPLLSSSLTTILLTELLKHFFLFIVAPVFFAFLLLR